MGIQGIWGGGDNKQPPFQNDGSCRILLFFGDGLPKFPFLCLTLHLNPK